MIRTAFGKVALFALTTAVAGVAMVGCSGSDVASKKTPSGEVADGKTGDIGLNLQPVSGVLVNVISYKVTQGAGGAVVKSGNIPVPGTGADFSFGTPLPVGTGYMLSLDAVSVDGKATCAGGAGPFNVVANQAVDVTPVLTCTDITTGQQIVDVDVETTACPDISFDYVVATPKGQDVGKKISVLSNAVSASATALSYSWKIATPAVGSFANALVKDTELTCNNQGENVLVTITATNGECSKSLSTKVSCANVLCGNGTVDPGETCDKQNDPTCPADCTQVCGDGVLEGTEVCEPAGTAVCGSDCKPRTSVCGDGFFTPSPTEECDNSATPNGAPAGKTCTADCKIDTSSPAACGNGTVEAGETCDGAGTAYATADCGFVWGPDTAVNHGGRDSQCKPISSAACTACETASECAELISTSGLTANAAEGPAVGTPRARLYNEVLDCVRDTHCAAGLPIDCYCGTASGPACDAGNGNGVCRTAIERGLETTNPADINARLTNLTLGGGLALARVSCDQAACTECL